MIEYLQKLTAFYPTTSNQTAVKKLLEYAGAHFENHGMTVAHHTYDGIHSLYASTSPGTHSRILLQGHVDVVPDAQPFVIRGNKIFGRGVYDMLFGVAAFMQLAKEMSAAEYDFAVMLSGDEEVGGFSGVRRLLDTAGYTADICILPDAGDGFGSLNVAAKGVFNVTVQINGRAHHGSRPWEGDGAAAKLVRFLTEIESLFDTSDQQNSTMTIAGLSAGHASNQGPAVAEAMLDIRYKDQQDLRRIEAALAKILKKHDGTLLSVTRGSDYQLDSDNRYVKTFIDLYSRHASREITFTKAHGSSDARFFSEKGMPVIMLRPDGGGAHGNNEWLSLASYAQFYGLLKEYVANTATRV